jgi:hypothetical protein
MEAELELAVWNLEGKKLWATFVEPPYAYHVAGTTIVVDVMGAQASFSIYDGPTMPGWWMPRP